MNNLILNILLILLFVSIIALISLLLLITFPEALEIYRESHPKPPNPPKPRTPKDRLLADLKDYEMHTQKEIDCGQGLNKDFRRGIIYGLNVAAEFINRQL